jgi:hypothetical protein
LGEARKIGISLVLGFTTAILEEQEALVYFITKDIIDQPHPKPKLRSLNYAREKH